MSGFISPVNNLLIASPNKVVNRPDEDFAQDILDWLTSGEAERPTEAVAEGEVVTDAEPPSENGHTQADLLALAKEQYDMDGQAVGATLKAAGFNRFDAEKWDEMVAALIGNGSEEGAVEEEVVAEAE